MKIEAVNNFDRFDLTVCIGFAQDVAWMQRSVIRDQWHEFPDYATLHPGYEHSANRSKLNGNGTSIFKAISFKSGTLSLIIKEINAEEKKYILLVLNSFLLIIKRACKHCLSVLFLCSYFYFVTPQVRHPGRVFLREG